MTQTARKPDTTWDTLVAQGREIANREEMSKWELGDLALQVAPMGDDKARSGALSKLRQYAKEIGVEFDALRNYRNVAEAWPHATRVACAWSSHRELMGDADRFKLIKPGMTLTQARQAAGKSVNARTIEGRELTTEELQRAMSDPDTARMVLENDDVRSEVAAAAAELDLEDDDQPKERKKTKKPDAWRHFDQMWSAAIALEETWSSSSPRKRPRAEHETVLAQIDQMIETLQLVQADLQQSKPLRAV